jgi:GWxTD domain-containing protein
VVAVRGVIALGLLCSTLAAEPLVRAAGDWSTSAAAYFLTSEERREWKTLSTDDARETFERDYWTRRDPTPGTPRNEFKEMVLARIQKADAEFALGKKRGSETAEGTAYVFVVEPGKRDELQNPSRVHNGGSLSRGTRFSTLLNTRSEGSRIGRSAEELGTHTA